MIRVAIVVHSRHGSTRKLAESMASGARDAGADVRIVEAEALAAPDAGPWDVLTAADAIVFGSPTYMGSVSATFKAFMDASSDIWSEQGWKDKLAAGFTSAVSPSGDKLNTLGQMTIFAAQHGMLWVSLGLLPGVTRTTHDAEASVNRLGDYLGLGSYTLFDQPEDGFPAAGDLVTAELFGRRIADAATRWRRGG